MPLTHQKYRPDIDGLRAIAILSVVAYHAFPGSVTGGFIGVDIFFVISGFLISTIILSNLENDSFSLGDFYIRCVRRIFPALILVLTACLAFGWYVLLADEFRQLGKHTAAGAAFVQNFILNSESGYFDNAAETKPLLHLWSLALEEQFYIFWPLMLAFVWKRNWGFLKIAFIIVGISFLINIYLVQKDISKAFYFPFSRFWELMAGGVLAYIILHKPQLIAKFKNTQAIFGLILLGFGIVFINRSNVFPGWWALVPVCGAFLLIAAGENAWINKNILGNKAMVAVGLISYPLYLWHWPLLVYTRIVAAEGAMPSREMKLLAITLAIFLSWLTYYFIERKIKHNKHVLLVYGLIAIMILFIIFGTAINKKIVQPRINNIDVQQMVAAANDQKGFDGLDKVIIEGQEVYQTKNFKIPYTLFIGDSHTSHYVPRVRALIEKNSMNSVRFLVRHGCFSIPDNSSNFNKINSGCNNFRTLIKDLSVSKEMKTIIIGGFWNCYFLSSSNNKGYVGENFGGDVIKSEIAYSNIKLFLQNLNDNKKNVFFPS